jgi:hypothetical protein
LLNAWHILVSGFDPIIEIKNRTLTETHYHPANIGEGKDG